MVYGKENSLCKALSTPQSRIGISIYCKEQDVMIWRFYCCSNMCYCITTCMSTKSLTHFPIPFLCPGFFHVHLRLAGHLLLLTAVTSFLGPPPSSLYFHAYHAAS